MAEVRAQRRDRGPAGEDRGREECGGAGDQGPLAAPDPTRSRRGAHGGGRGALSGNELAHLIVSNSKELNISKFYQGLPKKFPFPKLRLFYLKMYLAYHSLIDK